jgi:Protein of unknown function (DUF2568)
VLLVVAAILVSVAVWHSGTLNRWSAVPLAAGLVLYIPQFSVPQALRIATRYADTHRLLARLEHHRRIAEEPAVTPAQRLLLVLRVLMEIGVVAALAFWGVHLGGGTTAAKIALGVAAPALGFGFWGTIDFHQAGRFAETLRLVQELTVSLLATFAGYTAGRHGLAIALGGLSLVYHTLVYATGERLLKPSPKPAHTPPASHGEPARS